MDKNQRDIINEQNKRLEYYKNRNEKELQARLLTKLYSNINLSVEKCKKVCYNEESLYNCVYKRDLSYRLGLDVFLINSDYFKLFSK